MKKGSTYALLKIPLNNAELARVRRILHDEPAQRLLVLAVHLAGLGELRAQLLDALCILLGVHVDDNCVDHFGVFFSYSFLFTEEEEG